MSFSRRQFLAVAVSAAALPLALPATPRAPQDHPAIKPAKPYMGETLYDICTDSMKHWDGHGWSDFAFTPQMLVNAPLSK